MLHEQAEQDEANGEVDLVLQEQLQQQDDDQTFEMEEYASFAEELTTMHSFKPDAADEVRLKTYTLASVPRALKLELDEYIVYRTQTFAARRQGGAVQSISAETDRETLLRFYGYLDRLGRMPVDEPLLLGNATKVWRRLGWQPTHNLTRSLSRVLKYWRRRTRGAGASLL